MPTQADGAARSEFVRAAPYRTFRVPPDCSPAESTGTTVGFSSTHFLKSPRCSTGLFRTTQLCSEVWHNGEDEWQKPSPLSRRPSYRNHVLAQLSRQRPLRSSFSTLAHVLLPRKGGESTNAWLPSRGSGQFLIKDVALLGAVRQQHCQWQTLFATMAGEQSISRCRFQQLLIPPRTDVPSIGHTSRVENKNESVAAIWSLGEALIRKRSRPSNPKHTRGQCQADSSIGLFLGLSPTEADARRQGRAGCRVP